MKKGVLLIVIFAISVVKMFGQEATPSTKHNHRIIFNPTAIFSQYTPGYEIYYQMPVDTLLVIQFGAKYVNSDIAEYFTPDADTEGFKFSAAVLFGGDKVDRMQLKYGPKAEYYYTIDVVEDWVSVNNGDFQELLEYEKYTSVFFASFTLNLSIDFTNSIGVNLFLDSGWAIKETKDNLPFNKTDENNFSNFFNNNGSVQNKIRPKGTYTFPRVAGGIGVYYYF